MKLSVSTANADKKVSAIRCLGAIADYAPAVFATNSSVANEAVKQLHDVRKMSDREFRETIAKKKKQRIHTHTHLEEM